MPDDEPALRKRVGIAAAEKVGATYQEALQYPSLNIRGLASAGVGEQAANVVPHRAVAELDLRTTPEVDAARQPVDSAIGRWGTAALERAFAGEGGGAAGPVRIRMIGGTVPTHEIVTPLRLPFVIVPLVNSDNNQHTFDGNLRMGSFLDGMRTVLGLLLTPYGE